MNGREVGTRYLVANGVAPADKLAQDLQGNGAIPNDIVFYNPKTGKTLGPGVTFAQVPVLGVAQAVSFGSDGLIDALRPIGSGSLDGRSISSVTTDAPNTGITKIKDVFFRCTFKDTSYGLSVQWRNDDTLDTNLWNQWSSKTLSVSVGDYACESCDDGVDNQAVACAMADQFYARNLGDNDSMLIKRAMAAQVDDKFLGVDVYPILNKEVQFCIASYAGACDTCNEIDAIGGITIKADATILNAAGAPFVPADIVVPFAGTLVPGSTTRSFYGQQQRIIKLINKAFTDAGVTGYAVAIEGISGSGRPCTDFKILINSCYSVTMQDGTGADMTACLAEYNPYTGISFDTDAACKGCAPGSSFVPTGGLRVVGRPLVVNSTSTQKFDPKSWWHVDVDIVAQEESNFTSWYTRDFQDVVVPQGMGVQYAQAMLNQVATGPGFNYPSGLRDDRGLYHSNEAGELKYNTLGLNFNGLYRGVAFQHSLASNFTYANSLGTAAKWSSFILIEETNTAVKTAVAAILDPWLASCPIPIGPLDMTGDIQDQTETVVDGTGTVTQEQTDDQGLVG